MDQKRYQQRNAGPGNLAGDAGEREQPQNAPSYPRRASGQPTPSESVPGDDRQIWSYDTRHESAQIPSDEIPNRLARASKRRMGYKDIDEDSNEFFPQQSRNNDLNIGPDTYRQAAFGSNNAGVGQGSRHSTFRQPTVSNQEPNVFAGYNPAHHSAIQEQDARFRVGQGQISQSQAEQEYIQQSSAQRNQNRWPTMQEHLLYDEYPVPNRMYYIQRYSSPGGSYPPDRQGVTTSSDDVFRPTGNTSDQNGGTPSQSRRYSMTTQAYHPENDPTLFKKSRMKANEEAGFEGVSADGTGYKGDRGSKANARQKDELPEELNCALFLRNIHPSVTLQELLRLIRTGALASIHEYPASGKHPTKGAKLVFMQPHAARAFLRQIQTPPGINLGGLTIQGRFNRHGYLELPDANHVSRVIHVSGHELNPLLNERVLEDIFTQGIVLQIEVIRSWREDWLGGRGLVIEFRFARVDGQAEAVWSLLNRDSRFAGRVRAEYGPDPCDPRYQATAQQQPHGIAPLPQQPGSTFTQQGSPFSNQQQVFLPTLHLRGGVSQSQLTDLSSSQQPSGQSQNNQAPMYQQSAQFPQPRSQPQSQQSQHLYPQQPIQSQNQSQQDGTQAHNSQQGAYSKGPQPGNGNWRQGSGN